MFLLCVNHLDITYRVSALCLFLRAVEDMSPDDSFRFLMRAEVMVEEALKSNSFDCWLLLLWTDICCCIWSYMKHFKTSREPKSARDDESFNTCGMILNPVFSHSRSNRV